MDISYDTLVSLVGYRITYDRGLETEAGDRSDGVFVVERPFSLALVPDQAGAIAAVALQSVVAEPGADAEFDGLFVPYLEGTAVISNVLRNGWVASGPFSGCALAIIAPDSNRPNPIAAHLARGTGGTPGGEIALSGWWGGEGWKHDVLLNQRFTFPQDWPLDWGYPGMYVFAHLREGDNRTVALDHLVTVLFGSTERQAYEGTIRTVKEAQALAAH